MKNLILVLLLFGFMATGHSQILLKETKVEYKPESMKIDPITNKLVLMIPEKKFRQFESDPLAFLRTEFDMKKVLRDNEKENYDSYRVNFKSTHGHLLAYFDENGELIASFQKFRNTRLPEDARLKILQQYRDAILVKNVYIAATDGWEIKKEFYKVKIKDGNKTRHLKLHKENGSLVVAAL